MSLKQKVPQLLDQDLMAQPFRARESWRMFEILSEFVEATDRLQSIQPAVSM